MAKIRSVTVLTHPRIGLSPGAFLAAIAAEHWSRRGIELRVHRGRGEPPPADAVFVHVDQTFVGPEYARRAARYAIRINDRPRDISKRRVCSTLVTADDDYAGPVIIKTDRNHRGIPERLARPGAAWRLFDWAARRLPPAWTGRLPAGAYQVLARKDQVPRWVWRSPGLVVQRLHVERDGPNYVLRQWFFLGDRDVISIVHSRAPLAGRDDLVRAEEHDGGVPDALRARRAELGFDYGKFDFVMEDGVPRLFDANLTPTDGGWGRARVLDICARLAPGIDAFGR